MAFAIITGASKGIGKCIAEELAARGIDVLLIARSESVLKALSTKLAADYKVNAKYLAIDLAEKDAVQKIKEWCSENKYEVSILVNNAGYGLSGNFEKYTAADHAEMMQVNMNVPVELCHAFLPALKANSPSCILNVASSAAYQAVPGLTVYAASKAFVLSFSRGLHQELKGTGVSVTCVCPGATDTGFVDRAQAKDKARRLAEKVNMTPESVAKTAVKAMFSKRAEVIPGFINKVGAVITWLLPKNIVEKGAMRIYEP